MEHDNVKWVARPCGSGDDCWCRLVTTEDYIDGDNSKENQNKIIIGSAALNEEIANYIIDLHNTSIENQKTLNVVGNMIQNKLKIT